MKEKKNAVITFRTEEWIKNELQKIANENKWSLAQTVEELCKKTIACPQPEHIIIKTKDLIKAVKRIKEEGENTAVEIVISLQANEDETDVEKIIEYNVLITGGLGCISGFEPIIGVTKEELLKLD